MVSKVKEKVIWTKEELRKAVNELNEQCELDPPIEKGKRKQMRKDIREAMGDENLFEGREEFTKETYEVFEKLGVEVDAVKIKIDKKEVEKRMATKTKKKGSKKKGVGRATPGAYSTMIDILCAHPGMSREDLRKRLAKKGINDYKPTAFNTAYQTTNSIFNRLVDGGKLKLNSKG